MSRQEKILRARFLRILEPFLDKPWSWHTEADICSQLRMRHNTAHPILTQMEDVGWLELKWILTPHGKHSRGRAFQATPKAIERGKQVFDEQSQKHRFSGAPIPTC